MRLLLLLLLGGLGVGILAAPAGARGPANGKKVRPAVKKRQVQVPRCRDIFCTTQVLRLDGTTAEVKGLTEEQVEEVVQTQRGRLEPCLIEARRRDPARKQAQLEFVVSGAGRVLAVRVDGKRQTSLARCLGKQMRGIRFPSFSRSRTVASVMLAVPQ